MFYVPTQYQSTLENQTIIVFDDVMTSGATLNEIARILKDNGASRVINWVLLRTAVLSNTQLMTREAPLSFRMRAISFKVAPLVITSSKTMMVWFSSVL